MKKKITKKIKDKIISKENIINLIDYLYRTYEEIESDLKTFNISLYTNNSEVFEIENASITDDIQLLEIKRIEKIDIYLSNIRSAKKIDIELCQDSNKWSNTLKIESEDQIWVNNQNLRISELIESWKPQNKMFSKYKEILFHFLSINLGFIFFELLAKLLTIFDYKSSLKTDQSDIWKFLIEKITTQFPASIYVFIGLFSWLIGMFFVSLFWYKLEDKLLNLWPSIEFDFGPEHLKFAKKRRNIIWLVVTLIILPILLQILFTF